MNPAVNPAVIPGALLLTSVFAWAYAIEPGHLHIELETLEGRPPAIRDVLLRLAACPDTRTRTITLTGTALACLIAGMAALAWSTRSAW